MSTSIGNLAVREQAEELAARMRSLAPPPAGGGVDLQAIARSLNVQAVRLGPLAFEGQTLWTHGRPTITLRADMRSVRRRFTLAHELTHVILGSEGDKRRGAPSSDYPRSLLNADAIDLAREERLCDATAAALLMPRGMILHFISDGLPQLSDLTELASTWQVSLEALTLRVDELSSRPILLLKASHGAGVWTARSYGSTPAPLLPEFSRAATAALSEMISEQCELDLLLRFAGFAYQCEATGRQGRDTESGPSCTLLITRLRRAYNFDATQAIA